jgi:hypothetical protein
MDIIIFTSLSVGSFYVGLIALSIASIYNGLEHQRHHFPAISPGTRYSGLPERPRGNLGGLVMILPNLPRCPPHPVVAVIMYLRGNLQVH